MTNTTVYNPNASIGDEIEVGGVTKVFAGDKWVNKTRGDIEKRVSALQDKTAWDLTKVSVPELEELGLLNKRHKGEVTDGGYEILASSLGIEGSGAGLDTKCQDALILASQVGACLVFDKDVTFTDSVAVYGIDVRARTTKGVKVHFDNGGFMFEASFVEVTTPITSAINSYYPGTPYLPGTVIAGMSSARIRFTDASHGIQKGDIIKLGSETAYPWVTLQAKAGEAGVVAYVDGNDVWLDREIDLDIPYNKIFILGKEELDIELNITNLNDVGAGGTLVYVRNFIKPTAKIKVPFSYYQAVVSAGNFEADMELTVSDIRNFNDSKTKWGYGLIDKNSESSTYKIFCTKIRHGYTTTHGGSGTTPDCYGQAKNNTISGVGTHCITPFDTHASGESLKFKDCLSMYSLGVGFSNRSSNTVYENCHTKGSSDSGWQNFDGEGATPIGHNKRVTLINCTSIGHKRGLKSISNTQKDLPSHRFEVVLLDCILECDTYTECVILRNTTMKYNNLKIKNLSSSSSVTESSWGEENPLFIRSFLTLINSTFVGEDLKLVAGSNALNIYPFSVEVDRSQDTEAINIVTSDRLYLNNEKYRQFSNFGELVINRGLHGRVPSQGAIDYTEGMDYNYLAFDGLMVHTKNLDTLMRDDVQAHFKYSSQIAKRGFYYFNTKPALEFSTLYRLANDASLFSISTQSSADYLNAPRTIDLKSCNERNIIIRCLPITPVGETGDAVIDITELKNLPGVEGTGMRIDIINERPTGTVKITDPNVIPSDTSGKGQGSVASLVYTGQNKFVRV